MILSACSQIKEVSCFDCEYPHENYWIQKAFVGNGRCFLLVSVRQKKLLYVSGIYRNVQQLFQVQQFFT